MIILAAFVLIAFGIYTITAACQHLIPGCASQSLISHLLSQLAKIHLLGAMEIL